MERFSFFIEIYIKKTISFMDYMPSYLFHLMEFGLFLLKFE